MSCWKEQLEEKVLNITELALALNITRRTLYNWFKQEIIEEVIMEKLSDVINYEFCSIKSNPILVSSTINKPLLLKDEAYWQSRYIDLLERYAKLLQGTKDVQNEP